MTALRDHAQLFFMSVLLNTIDPDGEAIILASQDKKAYDAYFKNTDLHNQFSSLYRGSATNIYRCADGRCFHLQALWTQSRRRIVWRCRMRWMRTCRRTVGRRMQKQ